MKMRKKKGKEKRRKTKRKTIKTIRNTKNKEKQKYQARPFQNRKNRPPWDTHPYKGDHNVPHNPSMHQ